MNMTLTRVNHLGLQYKIEGDTDGVSCEVICETNSEKLTIYMNIERLRQCWYNWQNIGYHIQDAFHPLPAEQREFLLSGITPEKWNALFPPDEEEDENQGEDTGNKDRTSH